VKIKCFGCDALIEADDYANRIRVSDVGRRLTCGAEYRPMQPSPISRAEIEARISGHLDELLELWWAEQGVSKPHDLQLIASALPFPRGHAVRVLDLCCGPGDVGRAIRHEYPNAQIDCVDRDPFLTSICAGVNQRDQVPGKIVVADMRAHGWQDGLSRDYDAVVTANALHWFEVPRAEQLAQDDNRASV